VEDPSEIDYGKLNKRIVFTENDHRHAQLIIKLKHDGLRQSEFFRLLISGYLQDNPLIQDFIEERKPQSKKHKKKSKKLMAKGSALVADFGLNSGEIENIFDLIEEEHPEL